MCLFQYGALFPSTASLFDNVAFPLREHTRKNESEIRIRIVLEKLEMVGLTGTGSKLPGETPAERLKVGPGWPGRWRLRAGDHPARRARLRPRPGALLHRWCSR